MSSSRGISSPNTSSASRSDATRFVFGSIANIGKHAGEPIWVFAYDYQIGDELLLGRARVDSRGAYELKYEIEVLEGRDKNSPDLIVKARIIEHEKATIEEQKKEPAIAVSKVVASAGVEEEINLVITGGDVQRRPLFASLQNVIQDMKVGSVGSLEPTDVEFIASKTGFDEAALSTFVNAHRVARALPEASHERIPEIVFAVMHRRQLKAVDELAKLTLPIIKATFAEGEKENLVSAIGNNSQAWKRLVAQLKQHNAQILVPKDSVERALLKLVGVPDEPEDLILEVASLLADGSLSDKRLFEALGEILEGQGRDSGVPSAVFNLRDMLAVLSGDGELLLKLMRMNADWLPPARRIREPFELASLNQQDLRNNGVSAKIADQHLLGIGQKFPADQVYFALRRSGGRNDSLADLLEDLREDEELRENLDFAGPPVSHQNLGIEDADASRLERLQSLFKSAPEMKRAAIVSRLNAEAAEDAAEIVIKGKTWLRQKFVAWRFGTDLADQTFKGASTLLAGIFVAQTDSTIEPAEIDRSNTHGLIASLFSSKGRATCRPCQSELSPSAYLLDLVRFIRRAHQDRERPLQVLRQRRPDIERLELSCPNADVLVPYVDLALEVLEHAHAEGDAAADFEPRNTEGASAERLATPQHVNKDLYHKQLWGKLYPWDAPLDLDYLRWVTYLDHIEISHESASFLTTPPGKNRGAALEWAWDLGANQRQVVMTSAIRDMQLFKPAWGAQDLNDNQLISALGSIQAIATWTGLSSQTIYELISSPFVSGPADKVVNGDGSLAITGEPLRHLLYRLQMLGRIHVQTGTSVADLAEAGLEDVDGLLPGGNLLLDRLAQINAIAQLLNGDFSDALDLERHADDAAYLSDALGLDEATLALLAGDDLHTLEGLRRLLEMVREIEESGFTGEQLRDLCTPTTHSDDQFSLEAARSIAEAAVDAAARAGAGETEADQEELQRAAIEASLAASFDVSPIILASIRSETVALISALRAIVSGDETSASASELVRIHKLSLCLHLLGFDQEADIEDFMEVHQALPFANIADLPSEPDGAVVPIEYLLGLERLIRGCRRLFGEPPGVTLLRIDENGAAHIEGAVTPELMDVLRDANVNLQNAGAITSNDVIPWMAELQDASSVLGIPLHDAAKFFLQQDVEALETNWAATKTEEDWLAIQKSINDPIRKTMRDMLVRARLDIWRKERGILENRRILEMPTEFDLYDFYLIDPETDPCFETSRLKQATASLQQFVQRIMLGLEPGLAFDEEARTEWRWRKNYRVWEANRKVFLFPENWLEPDLRDNKTELFMELEDALLQDEVNTEIAETALLAYLRGLNALGGLQVVAALAGDQEKPDRVFARTRDLPHTHYMMERAPNGLWSGWRHIDIDIDHESLVPVVHNRLLYLFWPTYREEPGGSGTLNRDLTMNWTVLNPDGSWQPKKQSQLVVSVRETRLNMFSAKAGVDINIYLRFDVDHADAPDPDIQKIRVMRFDPALDEFVSYSTLSSHWTNSRFGYAAGQASGTSLSWWIPDVTVLAGGNIRHHTILQEKGDVYTKLIFPMSAYQEDFRQFFLYQAGRQAYLIATNPGAQDNSARSPSYYGLQTLTEAETYEVPGEEDLSTEATLGDDLHDHRYVPAVEFEQITDIGAGSGSSSGMQSAILARPTYGFVPFFHPYAYNFLAQVVRFGLDGFYKPDDQSPDEISGWLPHQEIFDDDTFHDSFEPTNVVINRDLPLLIEFDRSRPFAVYNWEAFYHAPMMIAQRLSENRQFADAQRWFHFVFDPTVQDGDSPTRFWRFRPFILQLKRILGEELDNNQPLVFQTEASHMAQIEEWEDNPFNPHAVARMRTLSYMRATVIAYLDNIIAWADDLFRLDTLESLNEATQLYVLASQLLGPRPADVPAVDDGDSALTAIELLSGITSKPDWSVAPRSNTSSGAGLTERQSGIIELFTGNDYFCKAANDRLDGYWSTVEDRMFKLRHCQNIDGVVRKLPIYQPPIDPAMLVAATAAGLSVGEALSAANAPRPIYRFTYMLQKAREFTDEVKQLGGAILLALEKKDAEALSFLRGSHEIEMSQQLLTIRKEQVDEAEAQIDVLSEALAGATVRWKHHDNLIKRGDLRAEIREQEKLRKAHRKEIKAGVMESIASAVGLVPQFGTSNHFGGLHLAGASSAVASSYKTHGAKFSYEAGKAARRASRQRRNQDWRFHRRQAKAEIDRINRDILAARIRLALAENEVNNQERAIARAEENHEFLQDKFTNEALYNWMAAALKTLHYQAYQMASDLARKAEACMRHELGIESNIISYGHYDSGKHGLLTGEYLSLELRRLEEAYIDGNVRKPELVKQISLARVDPEQLLSLRNQASCEIKLPEFIFDIDHPGHYRRRIKSVSITMPALAGPQTTIGCSLTLIESAIRQRAELGDDADLLERLPGTQTIFTSTAQNDGGQFLLDFRDERYLPFEGAGAVSHWRLQLPARAIAQFDYHSISDVILHISYTAEDGGSAFREDVEAYWSDELSGLAQAFSEEKIPLTQFFSLRYDFQTAWAQLKTDETTGAVTFDLSNERFPYLFVNRQLILKSLKLIEQGAGGDPIEEVVGLSDATPGEIPVPMPQAVRDAIANGTGDFALLVIYEVG